MNRHFEDTLYYLKRAGETAKKGLRQELEPAESRVRALIGREREPEPSRLEKVRAELKEAERKAEGEAKDAIGNARETLDEYRGRKVA